MKISKELWNFIQHDLRLRATAGDANAKQTVEAYDAMVVAEHEIQQCGRPSFQCTIKEGTLQ